MENKKHLLYKYTEIDIICILILNAQSASLNIRQVCKELMLEIHVIFGK